LARRRDLELVGLLDERYFMYLEDVDLCAAVRARGRAVLFDAGAEVQHLRGLSRASAPGPTADAYRRSQLAFYAKHRPRFVGLLRLYLRVRGVLPDGAGH
jgi:GT2 family glycosyltransferase